jgi:hypothetical protein
MHFREQDFVRMMSNQYEILFSQALDSRTQGQNRQLQVRFDSFSIQRESLSVSLLRQHPISSYLLLI